jgi:hypothetical protein
MFRIIRTRTIPALLIALTFTSLSAWQADADEQSNGVGAYLSHTFDAVQQSIVNQAQQVERDTWQQPYGGCKEAVLYADSEAAQECREHGWVIRPRLAINPHGVLKASALPHCRHEDGSGQRSACLWDAGIDGINGRGDSFIERHGKVTYVWMSRPHGQWVSRSFDADLDRLQGRKDWTRCAVTWGPDTAVRCPDGVRVAL